jgi:hypothetical protein
MNEFHDRADGPVEEVVEVRPDAAPQTDETPTLRVAEEPVEVTEPTAEANGTEEGVGTWRTEAGRKGAKRVHQLIQAGKLYEQEHGLKSGRQRLRQLIELGKLYEQEHGTGPAEEKRDRRRLSRAERDEVVATLLQCLVRMAKPSFRADLERLARALSPDKAQAA